MVSLIARAAVPQALLPFRYVEGTCFRSVYTSPRATVKKNKDMAGGTPATPAAIVCGGKIGMVFPHRACGGAAGAAPIPR